MIRVALIDRSSVATGPELDALATALTVQARHVAQAGYPVAADVRHYRTAPPASAWQLVVVDDADQADALGYHTTTPAGQPLGRVFARAARDAGLDWRVTASHELVEMLVDPWATLGVDLGGGTWLAWEACDPVEADAFGYHINGLLVSDFLLPAWFVAGSSGPFDWTESCPTPLTLLPGGYVAIQRGGVWDQIVARSAAPEGVSRAAFAQRIDRRRSRHGRAVVEGRPARPPHG